MADETKTEPMLYVRPGKRGGARPGSGPKIIDGVKRSVSMSIRVTPEQRDRLRGKAERAGKSITQLILDDVLGE